MEQQAFRGSVHIPAMREQAGCHQGLFSEEQHQALRIIRHLLQHFRRGERKVPAPEGIPPWVLQLILERAGLDIKNSVAVKESCANESRRLVRLRRVPVWRRAQRVVAAVGAQDGFLRLPPAPRQLRPHLVVPLGHETHVAVDLHVEVLASPHVLREISRPAWTSGVLSANLQQPNVATGELRATVLRTRGQRQLSALEYLGQHWILVNLRVSVLHSPQRRQIRQFLPRERVLVFEALPHQAHEEKFRPPRLRQHRAQRR
mmetsp:Transcript_83469/g.239768  ORF Transcript_83469/g.239768 Transcript_83469/m.239768 type:complete len:260 (-) Transcript_83469:311-1090(-)